MEKCEKKIPNFIKYFHRHFWWKIVDTFFASNIILRSTEQSEFVNAQYYFVGRRNTY